MYFILYKSRKFIYFLIFSLWILITLTCVYCSQKRHQRNSYGPYRQPTTGNPVTHKICMNIEGTLKARHKSCFLRPDTGPCRADIIQWYFDPQQHRCYRFYWGGCQGNGNRFETKTQCRNHCFLNATFVKTAIPFFCSLAFEYGDCFGYFHRWGWDKLSKTCKRYMYSGCGGNQNNFETHIECMNTCISAPNNTMQRSEQLTTCVPLRLPDFQ